MRKMNRGQYWHKLMILALYRLPLPLIYCNYVIMTCTFQTAVTFNVPLVLAVNVFRCYDVMNLRPLNLCNWLTQAYS